LDLTTKHQNNSTVEKIGLPNIWLVHHCETNLHSGIPTQVSRFHEGSPHVSCFIVGALHHASTIPKRTHEPPPPIVVDGEQDYEIKEFLDLGISHCQLQYLVHWQGYDISERTWEHVENLSNAMEKMKDFHM
jgi:hypothetical protein